MPSSENRELIAALYHSAAIRAVDFLFDRREQDSPLGRKESTTVAQRRTDDRPNRRAAGDRA